MKKLMIACAAVAMAAGVQAATINWSSQKTVLCDETGAAIKALGTGQSVVLIALDSVTADWSAGTWTAEAGSVTEYQTGTIVNMGTIGKVSGSYKFTLGDSGEPANGTILAMVFKDTDGSYRQLEYYGSGTALTETAVVSGLATDANDFTANFGSASESKMLPASVPEPTSAMLLVLGLGALALRRRRA